MIAADSVTSICTKAKTEHISNKELKGLVRKLCRKFDMLGRAQMLKKEQFEIGFELIERACKIENEMIDQLNK